MSTKSKTKPLALVPNETHKLATVPTQPAGPAAMILTLADRGIGPEQIEKYMQLQRDHEANEARKAYVSAMAEFKANPPEILKRKHVSYSNNTGHRTEYMHATLADVTEAIVQGLAAHGFSHRWDTQQIEGGVIIVTCVLTHRLGHYESTPLRSLPDQSGGKNAIQAVASSVSYLQRYTLLSATGLATKDMDDDGRGFSASEALEPTKEEIAERRAIERKAQHDAAAGRNSESLAFIKERIASGDLAAAKAEWRILDRDDQIALWLAPSKGGIFTTEERTALHSSEAAP